MIIIQLVMIAMSLTGLSCNDGKAGRNVIINSADPSLDAVDSTVIPDEGEGDPAADQMTPPPVEFAFVKTCPRVLDPDAEASEEEATVKSIMLEIGTIDCAGAIEKLKQLESLDLNGYYLSDLSPLAGLPANIKKLFLDNNLIVDITPLRSTSVEELDLSYNDVSNFEPIKGLAVKTLKIGANKIESMDWIEGLPALESISLANSNLAAKTLNFPSKTLKSIDLDRTNITGFGSFTFPGSIEEIYAADNRIAVLDSSVALYPKLKALDLESNPLTNISVISSLPNLKTLLLYNALIPTLSPIATAPGLETISYRRPASIAAFDYAFLSSMKNLKDVEIEDANLRNLAFFEGSLPKLERLALSLSNLTSLQLLTGLTNLQDLNIGDTAFDAPVVGSLVNLKGFACFFCRPADLTPFAKMKSLAFMNLQFPATVSVGPLANHPALKNFIFPYENLTDRNLLPTIKNLNSLFTAVDLPAQYAGDATLIKEVNQVTVNGRNLVNLAQFTNIDYLNVSSSSVQSIAEVTGLPIRTVRLRCSALANIAPLATLPKLHNVTLEGANFRDLSPLKNLRLRRLSLINIPLGSTVAKTEANCPTQGRIPRPLKDFCSAP